MTHRRKRFPTLVFALSMMLCAGLPVFAQGGRLHIVSHVDVTPQYAKETAKLLLDYGAATRKDPGALRVDVLVEPGHTNHFTLIEVWESRAAYDAHVGLDHTKAFRAKLYPWLGSPYDERLHEEVK